MKIITLATVLSFLLRTGVAEQTARELPPLIRARDLSQAYAGNEIAADLQYKGKIIIIDGGVSSIRREDNLILIEVVSATAYHWGYNALEMTAEGRPICCLFAKEDEWRIAYLRQNQHVQIMGICAGKIIVGKVVYGSPDELGKPIWKVVLTHCTIVRQFLPAEVKSPQRQGR